MEKCPKCGTTELEDPDGKWSHCEKCCATVGIGGFPFCKGSQDDHGEMHGFDDAFEPYVDVQLLPVKDPRCTSTNELGIRGVPINSRSERRKLMSSLGLQFGTQQFDEKRGKVIYGGAATAETKKGGPGFRRGY